MQFKVYATVFEEGVLVDRQVNTDAQSPKNREAYRKILLEREAVRQDPTLRGHEIVFNVRERNESAAIVLVAVERVISIAAFFLSGQDTGADRAVAEQFQRRAFAKGGQPEHGAIRIETPGCYMVVKKMGDDRSFSAEDLMVLVFNVENLAAAFFRDVGLCD